MTELWGMVVVLALACIVFGAAIVSLSRRVDSIEASLAKQRELRDKAIREVLANLKDK